MARRDRNGHPRFLLAAIVSVIALTLGGFGATASATMDGDRGDAGSAASSRRDVSSASQDRGDAHATEDDTHEDLDTGDPGAPEEGVAPDRAAREEGATEEGATRDRAAHEDDEGPRTSAGGSRGGGASETTGDASGAIEVRVTADRSTVPESGAEVTFTVSIRNSLGTEVEILHLHDSEIGALAGDADCGVGSTLGDGEVCSFTYTAWLEGAFPGSVGTSVTAEIRADGQSYGDSGSVTIRLTKASDASSAGTVKVDGVPFDDHPDDEPHPGCTFEIDFYGFPEGSDGELQATATFALWPPTGSGQELATASTDVGEDEADGGRDLDGSLSIDLSSPLEDPGVRAHPIQGYHVRLTVDAGGTVKHKVFWVDCGEAPTPTTGIHVDKSADVDEVPASGGDVIYTFTVENEGSADLTIDSLTDDVFGTLAGDDDCAVGTVLAAGTSCSFTVTETLSGTVGASHVNVFTASGTSHGEAVTDRDSASVLFVGETRPSVLVTKTADVEQIDADGGDVTFTFVVENTSSADLTITGLTDDVFGTLTGDDDCKVGTVLAAGTSCSFTLMETLRGYPGSSHVNVVTVTGTVAGETVTDTDSETVLFVSAPTTGSVKVTKTADVDHVVSGDDVTFTFVVENPSSADLTIIGLTDDVFGTLTGDADCQVGTVLAAGTSCSFTLTGTLSGTAGTSHVNVVTVTGTVAGETVTDSDSESVLFTAVSGGVVTPTPSPSPGQTPSPGTSPGQGPGVGPTQGGNGPSVLGASVHQTPVTAPSSLAFTGPSTGILLVLGGAAVALFVLGGIAYALGRRIRHTV